MIPDNPHASFWGAFHPRTRRHTARRLSTNARLKERSGLDGVSPYHAGQLFEGGKVKESHPFTLKRVMP